MVSVTAPGLPYKILLVDDNEPTRRGLKALLERAGFRVVVAASLPEGRFALSEEMPDLLISDVRLGQFNGLQLVATAERTTPTIMITGYPDPVLEADARQLGAEFLIKPFTGAALIDAVR